LGSRRIFWKDLAAVFGVAVLGVLPASSAPAARSATSNLLINVIVGTSLRTAPIIQRGGTVDVKRLDFVAGVNIESIGPDPTTTRVRLTLPTGLRWGADLPDAAENCTSTPNSGECSPGFPLDVNDFSKRAAGWGWNVIADAPGTYVLNAEVLESSASDPDLSDNKASVTVNVTAPLSATAVRLSPTRPVAGSIVSARVGVAAGGRPVVPTAVVCSARIGQSKVSGTGRAVTGSAVCRYRTPRRAGETLRGSVAFSATGQRVIRRFAIKLR
jgi:hypothetical protein